MYIYFLFNICDKHKRSFISCQAVTFTKHNNDIRLSSVSLNPARVKQKYIKTTHCHSGIMTGETCDHCSLSCHHIIYIKITT